MVEVPSGRIVTQGLSMPHSPRVHGGRLWVLDSGRGTLAVVDRASGERRDVCALEGFTRGLDFHGTLAFVGLSRVRESHVFGGTPLTARVPQAQRFCGIQAWMSAPGKVEGAVHFDSGVHEIFALQVMPSMAFPHLVDPADPLLDTSFALSAAAIRDVRPMTATRAATTT